MSLLQPSDAKQTAEAVAWANAEGDSLEIVSGGTKRALGRPMKTDHVLDVSQLADIIDYEAAELVLTARPGTSLASISAELEKNRQMLAFEPPDWRGLLGAEGEPDAGRRDRLQSGRIAARARRIGARLRPWLFRGERSGRNLEGGRQGRQERHRLRHEQIASGRLWHIVGADRALSESHAET